MSDWSNNEGVVSYNEVLFFESLCEIDFFIFRGLIDIFIGFNRFIVRIKEK